MKFWLLTLTRNHHCRRRRRRCRGGGGRGGGGGEGGSGGGGEEEEEEEEKQQQASAEVAITNTGQQNHQPNCAAVCVLLAAKERAQCTSVPDVMWACAWCLVSWNITPGKSVNHPPILNNVS